MKREEQRDIESTKYAEGIVEKTDAWSNYPLRKRMECQQFDGYHLAEACMCGMEWADSHPNWISVEDELPKVGASVLFVHPDESEPMAGYITRIKTWWSEKYRCSFEKVTHWMPLPQLPRKEDKK